MPQAPDQSDRALYPIEQSFVIALRGDGDDFPRRCAGRVEHVVSGQCATFEQIEGLLAFMARHIVPGE